MTTADCGRAGSLPWASSRHTGSVGEPCKSTLVPRCECQDEWETASTDGAGVEAETSRLRCVGREDIRDCADGEGPTYTTPEETHTVWLPTMRAQSGRAATPPRPAAAGEHPMWTAANEELSTKTLLPPEDTQDGLSSSSLLASFIVLLVIRMRRRSAVQKRRVQAVPLSRKAPVDARKTMLSRYSAALLLLASPGAHGQQTTAWHECCTHSSIRGGDMMHGAMNGGDNDGFSQAIAQAMCELLDTCAFGSWWGTAATSYGKKYSTRHTTLNTGVSRVTSGNPSKALIFSRCRPELQPMHAPRRAAH